MVSPCVSRMQAGAALALALAAAGSLGCRAQSQEVSTVEATAPSAVSITTVTVLERPITRVLRVTGSLVADEQAEVGAETPGRITATPVERGTRVARGAVLVRISSAETAVQLQEAEANAAQIQARLGLPPGQSFDPLRVPEVMNAKASLELAEAEFDRIESLLDQRVVSQSEFDQRRMQVEAARQQYQAAQNGAQQSFRQLEAARARVALAVKSLADTEVRAPFDGMVVERQVSAGDYVNRGTVVATVVKVDALRLELSVPEQSIGLVRVGQRVTFSVDSYPGRQFQGTVRFVSPALRADQRALTVEAIVPNRDVLLKPGLFATADLEQPDPTPALLVPATAIQTSGGTSRVFLVHGDRVEERLVSLGQTIDGLVEIQQGLARDDRIAAGAVAQLTDGAPVKAQN